MKELEMRAYKRVDYMKRGEKKMVFGEGEK
jgi:hypothetical protein